MYKKILIATDGSEQALKAVDQGLALAKSCGARVVIITVSEAWTHQMVDSEVVLSLPTGAFDTAVAGYASKILATATEKASAAGVPFETVHVRDRHPADGIVATAAEKGCDLIVMSSHGRRGVARLLIGSQTQDVLTHSKIPVLVCR